MTAPLSLQLVQRSQDGVLKLLFELCDGERIESVVIPGRNRTTLCVSSQAGCAVGCTFCATATMGLRRNLTAEEIVAQYVDSQALVAAELRPLAHGIENLVFMGMGEPFLNYDELCRALRILIDLYGFHSRVITVSTIGIAHRIVPFGQAFPHVRVAVSLHHPDDAGRERLVPLNRRHGLDEILAACREYNCVVGKKVFFEYVLIEGANDSLDHARALGTRLQGIDGTVNLIPLHPGGSGPQRAPARLAASDFRQELKRHFAGHVTFRVSRGLDIDAACGQLAVKQERFEAADGLLAP
jgi:23S rRNA (adenine2503-C2)-methyltransferase